MSKSKTEVPEVNAGNSLAALMNGINAATKGQQRHVSGAHATHVKNASLAQQHTAGVVKGKARYANQIRTFSKGAKGTIKPR